MLRLSFLALSLPLVVTGFSPAPRNLNTISTTGARTTKVAPLNGLVTGDFPENVKSNYGEESRKYRRTYYSEEDWIAHRSNDRFIVNLLKTFRSGIVRELSTEIGTVAALSACICFYNDVFVNGYQDFAGVLHDPIRLWAGITLPQAELPTTPFTLSSSALGLLLVFRTNASYARWSEARKSWSKIVNHSRHLVRLGTGWMKKDLPVEKQRELLYDLADGTWAFGRSLKRHVLGASQDGMEYESDIRQRLKPRLAEKLIEAEHKPNKALHELTKAVNAFPVTDYRHVEMDIAVEHLSDTVGSCERIFSSPVPLVYTRHTERFLGFWILALPLALYPSFGDSWNHIGMLPAAILISFFFFGIEELAIQLEEPFSILPLEQLVKNIETSVDSSLLWYFEDLEEAGEKDGASTDGEAVNGRNSRVPFETANK